MKKKKLLVFGILIIILFTATLAYVKLKNMPVTVYYNNEEVYMIDNIIKEEDTVYLPVKNIFIGIYGENNEIKFNRDKNIITVRLNDNKIVITGGSKTVLINDSEKEYSMPAIIENNTFFVPMEFLEIFDLKAEYSSITKKVKITGEEPVNKEEYTVTKNNENNMYTFTSEDVSRTYDKKLNLVYKKENDGWYSYSYDKNDNLVFYYTSWGEEKQFEYDENGNLIYEENQDREWIRYEYDEEGNLINTER